MYTFGLSVYCHFMCAHVTGMHKQSNVLQQRGKRLLALVRLDGSHDDAHNAWVKAQRISASIQQALANEDLHWQLKASYSSSGAQAFCAVKLLVGEILVCQVQKLEH